MAKLYEIDSQILDCIDAETGEILDPEKLEALQIERDAKIESVALWYKNLCADAEAYKAEKQVFADREATAKKKAESLKKWLAYALDGQKMTTAKVAITFRKSESVEIEDEAAFVAAAMDYGRDDLLTFKQPTPNKVALKAAIKAGEFGCAGVSLMENQNIQIK